MDDNELTEPFKRRAARGEDPTTIFDPPVRGSQPDLNDTYPSDLSDDEVLDTESEEALTIDEPADADMEATDSESLPRFDIALAAELDRSYEAAIAALRARKFA